MNGDFVSNNQFEVTIDSIDSNSVHVAAYFVLNCSRGNRGPIYPEEENKPDMNSRCGKGRDRYN